MLSIVQRSQSYFHSQGYVVYFDCRFRSIMLVCVHLLNLLESTLFHKHQYYDKTIKRSKYIHQVQPTKIEQKTT